MTCRRQFLLVLFGFVFLPGLFAYGGWPWDSRVGLTLDQLVKRTEAFKADGYQPITVNGYVVGGEVRYCDIWEQRDERHRSAWNGRVGLTFDQFQTRIDTFKTEGYRPVAVNGYAVGEEERWCDIWEQREGPAWDVRVGLNVDQLERHMAKLKAEGFQPIMVNGYSVSGEVHYCGIWEQRDGPVWDSRVELTWDQMQPRTDAMKAAGYLPVAVSGCAVGEGVWYCDLWEKREGPAWDHRIGLTSEQWLKRTETLKVEDYQPVAVNAYVVDGEVRYCGLWERRENAAALQEPRVDAAALKGQRVVVIHDKAALELKGQRVGTAAECSVFTVDDVNGNWLWIKSQKAYLRSSDVIPFEQALDYYTRRIEASGTGEAYRLRAEIWRLRGALDLALNDMSEAIRLNPRQSNWYSTRGVMWHNKHDYDKAIADFDVSIQLNPKNGMSYHNRARAWHKKKDYDKALADFNEAIKLTDPNQKTKIFSDSDLAGEDSSQMINSLSLEYFVRGYTLQDKGDYENAVADYDESIRRDPNHLAPHIYRRAAWNKLQAWDKIIEDCTESLANDPKDASALNALARLRATCPEERHRNGQEAVEYATKACELRQWKSAGFLDTLAAAYAEAGDFEQAISWQQKAIGLSKADEIGEFETRLKLYRQHQPFHQQRTAN